MPGEDKDSHIYGFQNETGRNRYTQSMMEHTSNLFPNIDSRLSRLSMTSGLNIVGREGLNSFNDYNYGSHLDDFGGLVPVYDCLKAPC